MTEQITAEGLNAVQGDAFRALIPADMQGKAYFKDVNSFGDFVKKFDGAQTLLGQRATPGDDATPEQWDEFFNKAGRPGKPEEYPLPEIEGMPKDFIDKAGKMLGLQQLMHQSGMNKVQAKRFLSGFLKQVYAGEKAESEAAIKAKADGDAAFNKTLDEVLGKDRAAVVENGKKFLAGYLPDAVKPLFEKLDANQLAVVLAVTDGLAKKFTGEDPFRGGTGSGGAGGETEQVLIAQMQEIYKDPAYADPFKDKVKHADLSAKMDAITAKLRKMRGI